MVANHGGGEKFGGCNNTTIFDNIDIGICRRRFADVPAGSDVTDFLMLDVYIVRTLFIMRTTASSANKLFHEICLHCGLEFLLHIVVMQ